jgi:hypothetical protein
MLPLLWIIDADVRGVGLNVVLCELLHEPNMILRTASLWTARRARDGAQDLGAGEGERCAAQRQTRKAWRLYCTARSWKRVPGAPAPSPHGKLLRSPTSSFLAWPRSAVGIGLLALRVHARTAQGLVKIRSEQDSFHFLAFPWSASGQPLWV